MTPLEQWLSAATRGLSPESAARVRNEIRQHYDAACEAGDDAIAALGNPRSANRAYRKVLLTEQEAMLASTLTQPGRARAPRQFLTVAVVTALALSLSRGKHDPGYWPTTLAIYSSIPLAWFFPPNTLERSRIYAWLLALHVILVTAVAWWFNGWAHALLLAAVVCFLDYFIHYQRLSIFRKMAAGQTWSPLPAEASLSHLDALALRTLDAEPVLVEKIAGAAIVIFACGLAIWQPAPFVPMAIWITAAHLTRRSPPFCTEESSRWFRLAKWSTLLLAASLPVMYGSPIPWAGAAFLAWIFVSFDIRSILLRRKLPVEQWPRRLHW